MSSSTEAQRLIALSLGKIAISRQQKGGINLHKNLLVASVLHKARTTYMMDNFQTLLANRRAQAEKEAASKMIVEKPVVNTVPDSTTSMEVTVVQREVTDSCNTPNNVEAPHGKISEKKNTAQVDKENVLPVKENENNCDIVSSTCDMDKNDLDKQNSSPKDLSAPTQGTPIVSGKVPLKEHTNLANYVNQSTTCRCVGNKRRRSFVSDYDSISEPKKPRFEDDCENYTSDSESDYESDSNDTEQMQTEPSQVTNLVDIFNSGFNGLCKDTDKNTSSSQINVYVSADRSVSGHQYVLADLTCGTQLKDTTVAIPTAIALAV